MFGLFKSKSKLEKLQEKYAKIMKDAYTLSKTNRTASDQKYAQAEKIQQEIEKLK